jgi:acyl carrier protein
MTDAPVVTSAALEQAIARRITHIYDPDSVSPAAIDCGASFFDATGFSVGPHVLDSLDIVEILTALEVDFGVDIISAQGADQYDSVAKLARLLEQICDADALVAFEARWSS